MTHTIKLGHFFDSEGGNIEDGIQDGHHFKVKFYLKSKSQLITIFW